MIFISSSYYISNISTIAQHYIFRRFTTCFAVVAFVQMIPVALLIFILHGVGDIEVVEGATADNALCCAGRQYSQ